MPLPSSVRSQATAAASYVTGHAIMLFARVVTAVRGEWLGVEPVATQRIYFANHVSHGDFVLIWTTLPARLRERTRPVAGADYWLGSTVKRFIGEQVFRAVLVERKPKAVTEPGGTPAHSSSDSSPTPAHHNTQSATATTDAIGLMSAALRDGESLIIFPEGTRNTTEEPLLPFKSGLYHLAVANPAVEVVPVWIDNLHRVLPKGVFIPVPLACTVSYGEPITLKQGEAKADFIERAEAALRRVGKIDHAEVSA